MVAISLKDVNNTIKDIFNKSTIQSIDSVYQKTKDGYLLIIDFKNLYLDKTNIIYTKLIFNVDKNKAYLIPINDNYQLKYLYDINCNYNIKIFDSLIDLKNLIKNIFFKNIFGDDIKTLSYFIKSPGSLINDWFSNNDVRNISVYEIKLIFFNDVTSCKFLSFNFNINLNDQFNIKLTITKEKNADYLFTFKIYNDTIKENRSSLKSLIQVIGETLKTKYV